MDLSYFKENRDFYKGLQTLFEDLNIPVNYIAEETIAPENLLSHTYKENNPAHQLMEDVFILGMVDDAAFKGEKSIEVKKINNDYDGILIFGVILKTRDRYLPPTRGQLAEITRAFNREFHYTPVVAVFKYEGFIAIANAERLKYKQEWREGEKVGKVSLLRDIDINKTHTGHLRILQDMVISREGKGAVYSFADMYRHWQTVFDVSILNKLFYKELSNWYFWAVKNVSFPNDVVNDKDDTVFNRKASSAC